MQPRRSEAKTLVGRAIVAAQNGDVDAARIAVASAVSALDKAAKVGAIHENAAARRKSRLMLKVNAALGGEAIVATAKPTRQTGRAQATKDAKVRIAASRATKAKGEQTAAGKARAALTRSSRETATPAPSGTAGSPATGTETAAPRGPRRAPASTRRGSRASGETTPKAQPADTPAAEETPEKPTPRRRRSSTPG